MKRERKTMASTAEKLHAEEDKNEAMVEIERQGGIAYTDDETIAWANRAWKRYRAVHEG